MEEKIIYNAYTDGACSGNPGPGGYGVVVFNNRDELLFDYSYSCENTTNNRMELEAILFAIECFYPAEDMPNAQLIIHSDSAYAINCITQWAEGWSRNGWINSKKQPVANRDIIEVIYNYTKNFSEGQVVFEKCSGHSGIIGNELADAAARNSTDDFKKLLSKYKVPVTGIYNIFKSICNGSRN